MEIKTAKEFITQQHTSNFQVTAEDGKRYWISRSCAVCAIVLCKSNGSWNILVNKRGQGTPDWQGFWNIPCGYVDFGETCEQACSREILEECGIEIDPGMFELYAVNSNPNDSDKQNITIRYIANVPEECMMEHLSDIYSEKDEVDGIKWISFNDIDDYEWAFNHRDILETLKNTLA